MFSYRHAFHAGNHADVLKHVVLVALLAHFRRKDAPFLVVDTHAGAGMYALHEGWAAQRAEFRDGIERLWGRGDAPEAVAAWLAAVARHNADGVLRHYPGSPILAFDALRDQDRLRLFELHPSEHRVLEGQFARLARADARRVRIERIDGFVGLKAVLPPASRRALVLVDPPYEDKQDYHRVVAALREALRRFATGCYAIWYPQVARREATTLARTLERWPGLHWLNATLSVGRPPPGGYGLHGSGVFVVNPPFGLEASLRTSLPYLAAALAQDASAGWSLHGHEPSVK
ncbi:MAG: 23S rRNA (adenine(2030)-N(6))-methyltransferase RlmJ [Burkholderiaceae bacterium]|nr:23S rRNA (adenine(2030)-N(6))-methyltransferase RlmJ [Burkholderiaceae bacterium]